MLGTEKGRGTLGAAPESLDERTAQPPGAIMLNLDQNLGAFGIGDAKPLCASIPAEAPRPARP